jgi:lipoate-protein ligase A
MKDRSPEYAENTVSLSDCGVSADNTNLKCLFLEAFSRHFGISPRLDCLSPDEVRMSQDLLLNKYGSDHWNLQGDLE